LCSLLSKQEKNNRNSKKNRTFCSSLRCSAGSSYFPKCFSVGEMNVGDKVFELKHRRGDVVGENELREDNLLMMNFVGSDD
jgi:hypothetical protein